MLRCPFAGDACAGSEGDKIGVPLYKVACQKIGSPFKISKGNFENFRVLEISAQEFFWE